MVTVCQWCEQPLAAHESDAVGYCSRPACIEERRELTRDIPRATDEPRGRWCIDPRHAEPCPHCAVCADECDPDAIYVGTQANACDALRERREGQGLGILERWEFELRSDGAWEDREVTP